MYVCADDSRDGKRVSGLLQLELQGVVSGPMSMLGTWML